MGISSIEKVQPELVVSELWKELVLTVRVEGGILRPGCDAFDILSSIGSAWKPSTCCRLGSADNIFDCTQDNTQPTLQLQTQYMENHRNSTLGESRLWPSTRLLSPLGISAEMQ